MRVFLGCLRCSLGRKGWVDGTEVTSAAVGRFDGEAPGPEVDSRTAVVRTIDASSPDGTVKATREAEEAVAVLADGATGRPEGQLLGRARRSKGAA